MRIPDAYFSGLGQRVPELRSGPAPDTSGAQQIGQSARRLGDTLTGIGMDMARTRNAEIERQNAEIERLQKLKRDAEARSALFAHENTLGQVVDTIARDKGLTPQEKRDQLREQSEKVEKSFLQSVPDEYRFAFGPTFEQQRFKAASVLDTHLGKELQDEIRAAGMTAREQLLNSAKPLAEKLALLKDPDAWNWEAEGLSEAQRVAEVARLTEQATEAEIETRLNSEDPRAIMRDLHATSGEGGAFAHYADLSPKTRQAYIRTARSMIEQQQREAERRRKEAAEAQEKAARAAFEGYKEAREGLYPTDPAAEAGFWKLVAGTEYADKAKEVRAKTGALGYVAGKVKEDPLKYGAAQLGYEVPSLSVDNPAAWPGQLAARGEVAGVIKKEHGLPYLPVLTTDEAKGLAGVFAAQTPAAQVQMVKGLTGTLGKESVQRIAQQFYGSDPGLSMVIGLTAAGKDEVAQHVANGQAILKAKAVPMPPTVRQEMAAEFQKYLGGKRSSWFGPDGAPALAESPQLRDALFDAAVSAYTSQAATTGRPADSIDRELFRKSAAAVVGQIVTVRNKGTVLPDGVGEEAFLTNIRRIHSKFIEQAGGVVGFPSMETAAEKIREDGQFWEYAPGKYKVVIDGRYVQTPQQTDLILNLADVPPAPAPAPAPMPRPEEEPLEKSKPEVKEPEQGLLDKKMSTAPTAAELRNKRAVNNMAVDFGGIASDLWDKLSVPSTPVPGGWSGGKGKD